MPKSSSKKKLAFNRNRSEIMNSPSQTSRGARGRVCIDVALKQKQSRTAVVQKNARSSRDFLAQPLESTVFFRGSRITYSGRLHSRESEGLSRKHIDDIRLRSPGMSVESKHLRPVSLRYRYACRLRVVEKCIVRTGALFSLSPRLALRTSLIGAVFLGVISTILTYRYFGEHAFAQGESRTTSKVVLERPEPMIPDEPTVLGASNQIDDRFVNEVTDDLESIREIEEKEALEVKIREMVAGYPIEDMVPYIMEKDKIVAAFLVGIAKKESAWGKRVPLLKSHDCFNYWGYRGKRRLMGTGGHTCFNSPKDAVDTVSRRLEKLIYAEKVDTPAEMMVVWKCGYDCSTHNKADTKKWIQDVDLYFHQLDE